MLWRLEDWISSSTHATTHLGARLVCISLPTEGSVYRAGHSRSAGWEYNYSILADNSFRVSYAHNLYDGTLDRSYDYDHLGRLQVAHTGARRGRTWPGKLGTQDGLIRITTTTISMATSHFAKAGRH